GLRREMGGASSVPSLFGLVFQINVAGIGNFCCWWVVCVVGVDFVVCVVDDLKQIKKVVSLPLWLPFCGSVAV
ncbi:18458_t:CDS:2, partial [Gigaspora rosea]